MSFSASHFSSISVHTRTFLKLFKENYNLFSWTKRNNVKIVDIGTGPGTTLFNLMTLMPNNYSEIMGLEKEEEMVSYFSSLQKDPRIINRQFDIEFDNLPDDLKERFDFAISTNVLMYMKSQRKMFNSCSNMLKPKGQLFFSWCKISHLHGFYKELSKTEKWFPYTKEFQNWNNYFDTENPLATIEQEVVQAGLRALKIEEFADHFYEGENEQFYFDGFHSLDYISKRIPAYDLPKYREDFHRLIKANIVWDMNAEHGFRAKLPVPLLLLIAEKI